MRLYYNKERNRVFGGMRKLLTGYLQKERKYIIGYLGCVGIFCAVLFLYNIRSDAVLYAAVLSITLLTGLLVLDGIRYVRRYEQLTVALAAIPHELRELPRAEETIEELYQEKIHVQQMHSEELESNMRIGRQDMLDYYSLWAHQIKTPLSAMRLLLQSQENTGIKERGNTLEQIEEQEREFLKSLKMELFKTEQYVEMVLSYLRMEDMSSDIVLQWYPLDDMIRQAIKKYSPLFIMKKIRLEYRKCETMVLTDEKWLVFVLEQLLSNALKYTTAGVISVYQEKESGYLVIEDTGIGIQAEDLPRIFEKGFTGYNGRQDKKSTGIGLYLCKSICNQLNHDIYAESEEGKGTRICLRVERKTLCTD